jgi:transcriptional regulator with AAA-type ATPase domain/tetratricopeptide (TPR) repeat protein
MKAEILDRVGKPLEAARMAKQALRQDGLHPSIESRYLTVLGNIELEQGRAQESVRWLQSSVTIAKQGKCIEQLCWAELRLLTSLFEVSPSEASAGILREVRKHVAQLGDPFVSAALHVFVSEVEAKRGAFGTAAKHLRVARSLLDRFENIWLNGMTAIADFCVAYLSSDLDTAHAHAERALHTVRTSGHARTRLAALINLGHIYVRKGNSQVATRYFNDAWNMCEISPRCRDNVLDGFAQVALAQGDFEKCDGLIEQLRDCESPRLSYVRVWSFHTQLRSLIAQGRWVEAGKTGDTAIARATAAGDRALVRLLHLLRAEARIELDDLSGAAVDIVQAAAPQDEPPLEILAEIHRVIGKALHREKDPVGARAAFQRSARILHGIGHLRAKGEVEADAAAVGSRPGTADRASGGTARSVRAVDPGEARADLVLRRAAALMEQAARPDLLGSEVLALVMASGCASAAAIVSTHQNRPAVVEERIGWSEAEALAATTAPDPPAVPLGTWRNREWQLVGSVGATVAARTAWLAVHGLASCGRALAAARREARERDALWPLDDPDDPSSGLFISDQMKELLRAARRYAVAPINLLITGETGVGKEVMARVIHEASRPGKPFIPFNCAAVPADMLENQLFGHRRGAYTGADEAFPGVIRSAEGGTVFLDEIGEIGKDLQPKLLRFLETGEVQPLGEAHPVRTNVRVVAATNHDLSQLVREGRFREDLFFRLNLGLHIPPLRERREEIPKLVEVFLDRFARDFGKGCLRLSDETMEYLVLYAWPGNVRELMNELRRMTALAEADAILMPEHLHANIVASRRTRPAAERELEPTELVVRMDQPLAADDSSRWPGCWGSRERASI